MLRLRYESNTADGVDGIIYLPASKSISNRLSIIQALSGKQLPISNWSEADDSRLMRNLLKSDAFELDAGMAGTAIRFLTAYYAIQDGRDVVLKGEDRLHERPIKPLVEALQDLGAEIDYLHNEGYPPLRIKGKHLNGSYIEIDSSLSSQFVTALLLIAPYLNDGMELRIMKPSSKPYVEMTLDLMKKCGIEIHREDDLIIVEESNYDLDSIYRVENDWSSAAFIYQFFALSSFTEVKIDGLIEDSLQGDQKCAAFFELLGLRTDYLDGYVKLSKIGFQKEALVVDMADQPDLIIPFVFTAVFLLPSVRISGIHTLRLKESDRVKAMISELTKLASITYEISEDELFIQLKERKSPNTFLSVHNDHRMAMSLAPLAILYDELILNNGEVVSKSFPNYWNEIEKLGIISEAKS